MEFEDKISKIKDEEIVNFHYRGRFKVSESPSSRSFSGVMSFEGEGDGKGLGKLVLDIGRPYVSRRKQNGT